jgi:site-specific DNA-cytosine methylase
MSDKKKKIMIIGIATGVVLAAIIVSAIILFRNDTRKNIHDGGTFTEKITESTTEKKAEVKTTTKATTEKATKSEKTTKAATTDKGKKTTATTTESATKKPGNQATTEAKTSGGDNGKVTTNQTVTTETPTERPTTAATTERPTTEKPKPEPTTTEHVHTWKDVYETQEKKVCVSEAWDEDVYENQSFCSYCGKNIDGNPDHIFECGKKYYSEALGEEIYSGSSEIIKPVKVDTIHHPAEYEIQKEKIFVGRKCSTCGAWQ